MPVIGIMLEGQEDLTWPRFLRLAQAVEDLAFESLFRSDHLTALAGFSRRQSLALWPSLTALAVRTNRIRFGPLVCSITFHQPALLAKNAASLDVLSKGRFELGLGAGWHAGEHQMFGVDFPRYRTRVQMLDEGAQVIKALWRGQRVTFAGRHYQLHEAETYPLPVQNPLPMIMGGKNERQTLPIVAAQASEWNCSYGTLDVFRQKSRVLDELCVAIGRDPRSLRRSAMMPFAIGPDEKAAEQRMRAHAATFPSLPRSLDEWRAQGFIGGSPAEVLDQIHTWAEAGVQRFMLQHLDLDDLASLELLAGKVLPQVRS